MAGDELKIVLEKKQLPVIGGGANARPANDPAAGSTDAENDVTRPGEAAAAPVDAEAATRQLAADKKALAAKIDALVLASQEKSTKTGVAAAQLEFDIGMLKVKLAALRLRIAEAENRARPGSTPDETLQSLKRETLVHWGKPAGGVQIGLERVSSRDTYSSAGEVVEFRRRVRNVSGGLLETTLRFRLGAAANFKLYSSGRFSVSFGGPTEKSVTIKLPPGADQPIAGSEFRIETKDLQPGRYDVESYDRFQVGEAADAKSKVIASSPNWHDSSMYLPLAFDVVAANTPAAPAKPEPFVQKGGPDIAWGAPVQGLQAGVRYTRVRNLANEDRTDEKQQGVRFSGLVNPLDFSDPANWQWKIGHTVEAEVVVRNLSPATTPLTFAVTKDDELVELNPHVISAQVYEFGGPLLRYRAKSRVSRPGGHEPTDRERSVKLRPGDMTVVARTAFLLVQEPENKADIVKLPRVDAILVKPGVKYGFRSRISVRSSVATDLQLSTGQTRLWVRDENAPPDEPAPATDGRGKVTLSYNTPGAAPQADVVIRWLPESGLLLSKLPMSIELTNGGEPRTIEMSTGRYEVFRRVKLSVGSWTMDVHCDRQIVTVAAGKTVEVKFVRSREDAAVAKGQWPDLESQGVAGAFLTVHPIAEKILNVGDPDAYFDFEIDRETLIATTCGPDGKFALEPLPVGRYAIVLRAFREPAVNSGGYSLPYLVGVNTFNVLSEGRGVYFYPNTFRVRPRWNTPIWSPTRVDNRNAANPSADGAATVAPVSVNVTADSTAKAITGQLIPAHYGGFSQS